MDRSTMVAVHTVAMGQHWAEVGDRAVVERLLDPQAGAASSDDHPMIDEGLDDEMSDFNILIDPQSASEGEGGELDELLPPLDLAQDPDVGDETKVPALHN